MCTASLSGSGEVLLRLCFDSVVVGVDGRRLLIFVVCSSIVCVVPSSCVSSSSSSSSAAPNDNKEKEKDATTEATTATVVPTTPATAAVAAAVLASTTVSSFRRAGVTVGLTLSVAFPGRNSQGDRPTKHHGLGFLLWFVASPTTRKKTGWSRDDVGLLGFVVVLSIVRCCGVLLVGSVSVSLSVASSFAAAASSSISVSSSWTTSMLWSCESSIRVRTLAICWHIDNAVDVDVDEKKDPPAS